MIGVYTHFDYWYFFFVVPQLFPDTFGFWKYWWADAFIHADVLEQSDMTRNLCFPAKDNEETIVPTYKERRNQK